jgi:spore coat polysaccharide biosynthesis protein SpsF
MHPKPDLWAGEFGDSYTKRHMAADIAPRRALWQMLLPRHVESVLEVGANVGLNLEAIGQFSVAELYATEPNDMARAELEEILPATHVTADYARKLSWPAGHVDAVITSGVLIHVPEAELEASLREIHRVARRWIIAAEYFAPQQEMVPYRGEADALWRRDYGSLYLDMFPDLTLTGCVFAYWRLTGLDNLTVWVMEKGSSRAN